MVTIAAHKLCELTGILVEGVVHLGEKVAKISNLGFFWSEVLKYDCGPLRPAKFDPYQCVGLSLWGKTKT